MIDCRIEIITAGLDEPTECDFPGCESDTTHYVWVTCPSKRHTQPSPRMRVAGVCKDHSVSGVNKPLATFDADFRLMEVRQ